MSIAILQTIVEAFPFDASPMYPASCGGVGERDLSESDNSVIQRSSHSGLVHLGMHLPQSVTGSLDRDADQSIVKTSLTTQAHELTKSG